MLGFSSAIILVTVLAVAVVAWPVWWFIEYRNRPAAKRARRREERRARR